MSSKSPPHMASWNRRSVLKAAGCGLGLAASGWYRVLEQAMAIDRMQGRHCVILWMSGGPSQMDTFDMKPQHANGGEFQEIATKVPGIRFCEHLPQLAQLADKLAVVRSMATNEGDHARGTYLVRTGQRPGGELKYPAIGSALAKAMARPDVLLPHYFAISPFAALNPDAYGPGFLGPQHAATTVNAAEHTSPEEFAKLSVENLDAPEGVDERRTERRREMWRRLQDRFLHDHPDASPLAHDTVYQRAFRMMDAGAAEAFDLSREPARVREAYGRGAFGQSCLVARRLIERGVPLIEVNLGGVDDDGLGWDTHEANFRRVRELSGRLDAGWATLMTELEERGLLQSTTILWIGEFGRTPQINAQGGRDHYPNAWSCVLAGGGIQGGQVYGATSHDGTEITEQPVSIQDLLATLCSALDVDPELENFTSAGRPVRLTEGKPIRQLLL